MWLFERVTITAVHESLHWLLPVSFGINSKILVLAYKCVYGPSPDYSVDIMQRYRPLRQIHEVKLFSVGLDSN